MKTIGALGLCLGLASLAACAPSVPPQELINARTAYDRASRCRQRRFDGLRRVLRGSGEGRRRD